ncbi:zinc dependent phospholipase C family protein [Chitinophaga sp. sic0106]|uniref:zinc dependent phospholipase C family protein n=1 Tax=Chitinophaga sp. sic0106 TaxID=2854785 RepID=UPI001C46628D|nr:zinc dependent phospholipase C family protein [Chitinophaga sp. sic0106]MBV7532518.1 zinc dependent phospholipase C family protein [Chitinophaga sp. sic0106]
MPGPSMHHLIAQQLRSQIQNGQGLGGSAAYADIKATLSDPKHLPYLFLGCQGPDFLFFNTKDWNGTVGDLAQIYFKVYDAIEGFKKGLLDAVPQPIIDAVEAAGYAADQVIDNSSTLSEIEELFKDMQKVIDGLAATLVEMLKEFVTEFNVYNVLAHPYRDGQDKGKWWWFDAMHYRKTGRFAKALLDKTQPNTPEHLYALGYLTHFTADTVGHPFVNINSGGPYRIHAQRHKTLENYQDVFNMKAKDNVDFNRSKLHALYNFKFEGVISAPDAEDEIPDPDTHMPDGLAKLIAETLKEVFNNGSGDDNEYGPSISAEDVNNAYRLWYKWMRNATDTGTIPKPEPYSLTAELEEVWEKAMEDLGDIGDFIEDAVDQAGNFSFLAIFLILAALILAAIAAAHALIDAILGSITTLTTAGIRYAASLVYEQLYNAFQNFRLGVAFNGLAFPMQEHLNEPRFAQFKNTSFPDPLGTKAGDLFGQLPKLAVTLGAGGFLDEMFHREKHMIYPPVSGATEQNPAHAAPNSYFSNTALHYAFDKIPLSKTLIDTLATLNGPESQVTAAFNPAATTGIKPSLGNAMMLTEEIYDRWKKNIKFPDFNLDADRGYGYPCWTQKGDPREQPDELDTTPVDLTFIPPA